MATSSAFCSPVEQRAAGWFLREMGDAPGRTRCGPSAAPPVSASRARARAPAARATAPRRRAPASRPSSSSTSPSSASAAAGNGPTPSLQAALSRRDQGERAAAITATPCSAMARSSAASQAGSAAGRRGAARATAARARAGSARRRRGAPRAPASSRRPAGRGSAGGAELPSPNSLSISGVSHSMPRWAASAAWPRCARAVDAHRTPRRRRAQPVGEAGADLDRPAGRRDRRRHRPGPRRRPSARRAAPPRPARAAQAAAGRQERHRLQQVGLAGAVRAGQQRPAADRASSRSARIAAEIGQRETRDGSATAARPAASATGCGTGQTLNIRPASA